MRDNDAVFATRGHYICVYLFVALGITNGRVITYDGVEIDYDLFYSSSTFMDMQDCISHIWYILSPTGRFRSYHVYLSRGRKSAHFYRQRREVGNEISHYCSIVIFSEEVKPTDVVLQCVLCCLVILHYLRELIISVDLDLIWAADCQLIIGILLRKRISTYNILALDVYYFYRGASTTNVNAHPLYYIHTKGRESTMTGLVPSTLFTSFLPNWVK